MIVTPRDLGIAKYALRALARLVASSPEFDALLYCNGLSKAERKELEGLIQCSRVIFKDNAEYLESIRDTIHVGKSYVTDQGKRDFREGVYEGCGEVWSRELIRLKGELVAMVDADFEIFDHEFVYEMLRRFDTDPTLAVFSTDSSPTQRIFEPYSQQNCILAARWHTWFCIYRKSALEKCHDFSYDADKGGELVVKYDHSARLQGTLIQRYGYHAASLNGTFSTQFLHYGAFAKNRSLSGLHLWFYRLLRVGRHNGWNYVVRWPLLVRLVRKAANVGWVSLDMGKYDAERLRRAHEP